MCPWLFGLVSVVRLSRRGGDQLATDREYGDRLSFLASNGPVWIVDTPTNRAAAQKFWASQPHCDHLNGITTFKVPDDYSPENALINELETIDMHHSIAQIRPMPSLK